MAAKLQRGNADGGDTNEAIALAGRAQEQLQRASVAALTLCPPFRLLLRLLHIYTEQTR